MPERRERLRTRIAELEAELVRAEALDPALRARLEAAIRDLREALAEESGPDAEQHHRLVDHFSDAMRRFEATHPTLAGALARVVDALSALGI